MARLFTGDHSTGDFTQFSQVANKTGDYSGNELRVMPNSYSAQVLTEDEAGFVARYEVRPGDIYDAGIGLVTERSRSNTGPTALVGQTYWYAFSIKFADDFEVEENTGTPLTGDFGSSAWVHLVSFNPTDINGGQTGVGVSGSIIRMGWFSWGEDSPPGYADNWYINRNIIPLVDPSNANKNVAPILEMPIDRGKWQDIKLQVKWSKGADGFIRAWRNGQRVLFMNGADTFTGYNADDGVGTARIGVSEGIYRCGSTLCFQQSTQVVYFTGLRVADTEDGL